MYQPLPIEARVYTSRSNVFLQDRIQIRSQILQMLCCLTTDVTLPMLLCQPVLSSLWYTAVMYLLQALAPTDARRCLAIGSHAAHMSICWVVCRTCIAAFVDTVLTGGTKPGVWFPEEPEAIADRMRLLQQASQGCIRFELNQPPWKIESDAKQMGMGFYWWHAWHLPGLSSINLIYRSGFMYDVSFISCGTRTCSTPGIPW